MAVRSRSALYRQLFEHWAKAPHGAVEDAYAGKFTGFALNRPKARFIIFRDAEVLATGNDRAAQLDYFSARDILSLFRNPYSNETAALAATEPPGLTPPDWVLLGVEADHPTEHHHPDLPAFYAEQPVYWAVNVAPMCRQPGQEGTAEPLDRLLTQRPSTFSPPRQTGLALSSRESVLFAQATAMIDWNRRNQFCPSCGRHTVSSEAGYKRVCIPTEPAELTATPVAPPCVNSRGVHNSAYPRTDAVAIVCVISPDGQRVLLGRKAAFPKRWYTCVAGFVEPGETLENAVRREVLEETGVVVGNVIYYASQPWPYPNNLMMGCFAQASTEPIHREDKELDDAKWFDRGEVLKAIAEHTSTSQDRTSTAEGLALPPPFSIAFQLLKFWATREKSLL